MMRHAGRLRGQAILWRAIFGGTMAAYDVDLFVIGAGSGGVRAARVAAAHGAKVMIAEEFRIGGTCVIRGCVPKKLMVYASRYKDHFEDAVGFGWTLAAPSFDWPRLVAAKEKEISRLSAIYRDNLDKAGIAVEDGRAEIEDAHHVRLLASDRKVSARIILISTGAAPVLEPDVPGREYAITSNEIFDLKELPNRMLIIGGGYIAVEFASIFARLGTEVSLAARGENLLRGFDEDMRTGLREGLAQAGVKLNFGMLPIRIEKTSTGVRVSLTKGARLDADRGDDRDRPQAKHIGAWIGEGRRRTRLPGGGESRCLLENECRVRSMLSAMSPTGSP